MIGDIGPRHRGFPTRQILVGGIFKIWLAVSNWNSATDTGRLVLKVQALQESLHGDPHCRSLQILQ
jgi:hypothetical protein